MQLYRVAAGINTANQLSSSATLHLLDEQLVIVFNHDVSITSEDVKVLTDHGWLIGRRKWIYED